MIVLYVLMRDDGILPKSPCKERIWSWPSACRQQRVEVRAPPAQKLDPEKPIRTRESEALCIRDRTGDLEDKRNTPSLCCTLSSFVHRPALQSQGLSTLSCAFPLQPPPLPQAPARPGEPPLGPAGDNRVGRHTDQHSTPHRVATSSPASPPVSSRIETWCHLTIRPSFGSDRSRSLIHSTPPSHNFPEVVVANRASHQQDAAI
ncbi:hypothetical protein BXZ70DRAFT_166091 [Cristinia sonorae]|uniref:Uncharacterized protein n=1 Tax=Cristinia sonorae TaxID=1940300 RepID=A0A8K0XPS5_9AGAR|nr:hypothetical protein BXZ70DRAFT_166091 [Cristinia sonorae]